VTRPGKEGKTVKETIAILEQEREGERLAVLAWIHAGRPKSRTMMTPSPFPRTGAGAADHGQVCLNGGKAVKFKSIVTDRCVRCHKRGGEAGNVPFESFSQIQPFVPLNTRQPRTGVINWPRRRTSTCSASRCCTACPG